MDQSGTYVFAVRPMAILESVAKSMSYWTGNGDDTMVTLWNPADEAHYGVDSPGADQLRRTP